MSYVYTEDDIYRMRSMFSSTLKSSMYTDPVVVAYDITNRQVMAMYLRDYDCDRARYGPIIGVNAAAKTTLEVRHVPD